MMGPDDAIPDTSFAASLQELINHKIKQKHEVAGATTAPIRGVLQHPVISLFPVRHHSAAAATAASRDPARAEKGCLGCGTIGLAVAAIDSPVEKGTVPYGPVRPSLFHVGRPSSLFRHCPSSDTVPRPCSVLRAERIVGCNPLLPQLSVTQL